MEFLETLTLKDVAYSVDLTLGKVTLTISAKTARKSVLEKLSQKIKLIQFPNQNMKAACSTLSSSNLISEDLAA
jgi:hypothetical protein